MSDEALTDPEEGPTGLRALQGLARIGAELGWHTAGWALDRSLALNVRLLRAAVSPSEASRLVRDASRTARELERGTVEVARALEHGLLRVAAGLTGEAPPEPPPQPERPASPQRPPRAARPEANGGAPAGVERAPGRSGSRAESSGRPAANGSSLHARGEELIRLSRDVHSQEETHPAYERILAEIAPDESRILLLLLTKGPQPAVDVRTGGPLSLLSSSLIAPGLSMIGRRAGLRYKDRVPAYLNNLFRLGLVWFSRETLRDPLPYQVLEAQPDVMAAIHSVRMARIVRRSIHLTPFGEDFCRTCLPVDEATIAGAPQHALPPEDRKVASPPAVSLSDE